MCSLCVASCWYVFVVRCSLVVGCCSSLCVKDRLYDACLFVVMVVVCLFGVCSLSDLCWLLVLFAVRCSLLFLVRCSSSVVRCLLLIGRCLLSFGIRWLFGGCCVLIACCLLVVVCSLFVACCLLACVMSRLCFCCCDCCCCVVACRWLMSVVVCFSSVI